MLCQRLLLHYRRNVLPFDRVVISLLNLWTILLVITTRDCNFLSCLHFIVNMQFQPILQSFHGIPLQHSFGSSYLISHILLLSASFIASSFQIFANTSNLNIPSTFFFAFFVTEGVCQGCIWVLFTLISQLAGPCTCKLAVIKTLCIQQSNVLHLCCWK